MDIRFDDLDNNFQTTLDGDITDTDTTINLVDVPPNTTEGFLAIDADNVEKIEYIYFNTKGSGYVSSPASGGRGQGGTTAQDHDDGAVVRMYVMREHIKPLLDIVNNLYPIGSVYINAEDDTNPETLLGFGTWEAWGIGKAIVGIDTSDTDFDTGEKTGGHKEMQEHNHSGTTGNNKTDHDHQVDNFANAGQPGSGVYVRSGSKDTGNNKSDHQHDFETDNAGTGDSGNLQPYQVGYVWKRTA